MANHKNYEFFLQVNRENCCCGRAHCTHSVPVTSGVNYLKLMVFNVYCYGNSYLNVSLSLGLSVGCYFCRNEVLKSRIATHSTFMLNTFFLVFLDKLHFCLWWKSRIWKISFIPKVFGCIKYELLPRHHTNWH